MGGNEKMCKEFSKFWEMIQNYENNSLQNVILEGFAVNVYSRTVGGVCAMSGALFVLREIYSGLQRPISKIMIPKTTEPIFSKYYP